MCCPYLSLPFFILSPETVTTPAFYAGIPESLFYSQRNALRLHHPAAGGIAPFIGNDGKRIPFIECLYYIIPALHCFSLSGYEILAVSDIPDPMPSRQNICLQYIQPIQPKEHFLFPAESYMFSNNKTAASPLQKLSLNFPAEYRLPP
ncbi:hypothetical protein HMPREF1548_00298 [Clostridium sp. KLE 1755]|nr:hypothetical protein HMPREF1548_00298 [Clostridium sp. KLE 1755]